MLHETLDFLVKVTPAKSQSQIYFKRAPGADFRGLVIAEIQRLPE